VGGAAGPHKVEVLYDLSLAQTHVTDAEIWEAIEWGIVRFKNIDRPAGELAAVPC
jgi:hypothetical protein